MIREFALIDVYYLLLAARWTLALTGLAFLGGGMVGLVIAMLRVSPVAPLRMTRRGLRPRRPRHAAAGLAVRFLLRPLRSSACEVSPWIAARAAFSIYAGAFLGEIWRGCLQAIPRQQWEAGGLARPELRRAASLRHRAAGRAHRDPTDGRLPGAAHQEHVARRGHRLRRADARGPAHERRDVPALHRLLVVAALYFPCAFRCPSGAGAWKGRSMSLVELEDVVKRFGAVTVLERVSLDIEPGEIVAIIGRSGSGKSTLLRCINGLEPIQDGRIVFDGVTGQRSGDRPAQAAPARRHRLPELQPVPAPLGRDATSRSRRAW